MIDYFDPNYVHVLLDFEMLGPGDQAVVIGVGAVQFGVAIDPTTQTAEPFTKPLYEAWPISTQRQEHRTHTWDTVEWWSRQAEPVRAVAFQAMAGRGAASGKPLRLAVKELVDAVLNASRLAQPEEGWTDGERWSRIVWWAKPAAADLSLWMSLLREFRPDLALLYNRVRDVGTLRDAAYAVTRLVLEEPPLGAGARHSPAADAAASADLASRAMRALWTGA